MARRSPTLTHKIHILGGVDFDIMAYELHIEKKDKKISFSEWVIAVSKIEDAVLEGEPQIARNPKTGEIITIGGNPNNVSVKFSTSPFANTKKREEWRTCIFYHNGRASFKATEDIEFEENPVRRVAVSLARELNAHIVGDEGEVYNW